MAEGPPNGGGTAHSLLGKSAIERTFRSGRAWFAWMPRGNEKKNIELLPLDGRVPPKWGGYGPFPPREKRHRAYIHLKNVLHITISSAKLVMVRLVPVGTGNLD